MTNEDSPALQHHTPPDCNTEESSALPPEQLPVIYHDEYLVAVNKPSGLLVHRSEIDRHETRFALQLVRDQIGQRVYPVHRLDKPTSGVLVFALSPSIATQLGDQFSTQAPKKSYLAVVRGIAPEQGEIDHALTEDLDKYTDKKARQNKPPQAAVTHFKRLADIELPVQIDRYPTSRYSLVQCNPLTGRKHQIRRHMKHIAHPIIGDAKHGKGLHNRFFNETYQTNRLLLAATELHIKHPVTAVPLHLTATLDTVFTRVIHTFNWQNAVPSHWLEHAR